MKVPLKLNSIDQEHLQELYDAAGVARDELPYTAGLRRSSCRASRTARSRTPTPSRSTAPC